MTDTTIMPPVTRPTWRRLARRVLFVTGVAAAVGVLAGCDDEPRRSITMPGEGPRLSVVVPEGMSLQCPPVRGATARGIAAGGEHDDNGNGVVCDVPITPSLVVLDPSESEPLPTFTTDDAPYPTAP